MRGSSSPLHPSLAPARSLQGSPGSLGKTAQPSVTPEPSTGLFTLAGPADSFTDVTYRHAGTRRSRGEVERAREREREIGEDMEREGEREREGEGARRDRRERERKRERESGEKLRTRE